MRKILILLIIVFSMSIISCVNIEDTTITTQFIETTSNEYIEIEDFYDLSTLDISYETSEIESILGIYVLRDKNDSTLQGLVYEIRVEGYRSRITMLIAVNIDYSVQGYKVTNHAESEDYGAAILDNDFNITDITDLSGFDSVSGVTYTSEAILECFMIVSSQVESDFSTY